MVLVRVVLLLCEGGVGEAGREGAWPWMGQSQGGLDKFKHTFTAFFY